MSGHSRSAFSYGVALAALALLGAGCAAVRPVNTRPPLPSLVPAFVTEVPAARPQPQLSPQQAPAGEVSRSEGEATATPTEKAEASPLGAGWWTVFADPALDAAIDEALRNNYQIRDVRTLIHENELDPARPSGLLWPLQIGIPGTVQHLSAGFPSPGPGLSPYSLTYDEADVGIAASYQVDVWGKLDARRRTLDDGIEQQHQSTEIAAQNIAEQVTQLWFEILEQRALRSLLESQVQYGQNLLAMVQARFDQHLATRLAVLQQEQQLLNTQAQVPLVTAQIALLGSRLSALLGRLPTPNAELVPGDRRLPDLPPSPAVGAPADLLRGSPELHMAQARVAEAEHLVNENLASWLPTIELFGNAGVLSYNFSDRYFTAATGVRITWPIFDGGQRSLRARQLELTVKRRNWQYELAYKSAVQRVQEALVLEHEQADHLRAARAQVDLGRRVLVEARQLFEQGLADYLPVLTALASLSNFERASIQSQRSLLSYRVQLYHALGGTWSRAATKVVN